MGIYLGRTEGPDVSAYKVIQGMALKMSRNSSTCVYTLAALLHDRQQDVLVRISRDYTGRT